MNAKEIYNHIEKLVYRNTIPDIELKSWELIVQILRESNLLAACYFRLKSSDRLEALPKFAKKHLKAASIYSQRQADQVLYECRLIRETLNSVNIEPVYLKGAGYTLRKSRNAFGRVYSDIDVLVHKDEIDLSEKALTSEGWKTKKMSDYDDRYYREWSHEIPPMVNMYRGTVLDLHHNITLPISGRSKPLGALIQNLKQTDSGAYVLSSVSAIIHSAVHLMINEDVSNAYRDLLDILTLIEDNKSDEFWLQLEGLSQELGFYQEVYLVLIMCNKFAGTQHSFYQSTEQLSALKQCWLNFTADWIYYYAFQPHSSIIQSKRHKIAISIVYLRGHFKKMPLKILIPHMITKSFLSIRDKVFGKYHFDKQ